MTKNRKLLPKASKEAVFREFSNLCAICERPDPQIHHINEDPSNNDLNNLIPLCANCHLSGQHHPTRIIEPGILRLYRKQKVPGILSPQFEVMWSRLKPLYNAGAGYDEIREALEELARFTKGLNQGHYFASKVAQMIPARIGFGYLSLDPEPDHIAREREREEKERQRQEDEDDKNRILSQRNDLERWVADIVKFQNWKRDETKKSGTKPLNA